MMTTRTQYPQMITFTLIALAVGSSCFAVGYDRGWKASASHHPTNYIEKEVPVELPDPKIAIIFGKDDRMEMQLVDSKGKVWERIGSWNDKPCSIDAHVISNCAFTMGEK